MIKSFLIIISFPILLFSSKQIILVVADNFDSSKAMLECYEGNNLMFKPINVNIGKNGLAWGLGELSLKQNKNDPQKFEGDKKAPAGVFKLTDIFGYSSKSNFSLPYLHASKSLICVDDSYSKFYNQIIQINGNEKSFEYMKRDDQQYELGIVVQHNKEAKFKRGSCIFLHVQRAKDSATLGCTSMELENMKRITKWLKKDENPILIQIPRSSRGEILKLFGQLKNSKLLQ